MVCAIGGRRSVATRALMAAKGPVRPGGDARTQWDRFAQATDARGVIDGSRESRELTAGAWGP